MAPRKNYDSNGNEGQGEGRSRSNSGSKRGGVPKQNEDYRKRRERNNIAVRKSRQLSRQKAKVTQEKVSQLRQENKELEQKVQLLSKELSVLRDLFMSTAAVPQVDNKVVGVDNQAAVSGHGRRDYYYYYYFYYYYFYYYYFYYYYFYYY
nr:hypothetical protein BaRGS_004680 [Batillaria attramentaria]